jgi:hypothetical protein
MRWGLLVVLWLAGTFAFAQESMLQAEFRREGERVSDACKDFAFKTVPGCAIELFTDHPLHIAAGSMPPQNGFGVGAAFVADKNTKSWRLSWDVDAVGSTNGSWRAGGYMKMIHTPAIQIKPIIPETGATHQAPSEKHPEQSKLAAHPYTVFNLYAQSISLNKLYFFGLGNDSLLAGQSVFGMTESIVGGTVIKPVYEWPAIAKLKLALLGELNGRFVNVRGERGQSAPSIQTLYTDATAPGLVSQPGFVQLGEGVRIEPVFGDHFQLNYLGNFQQFFAPSSSENSFLRWTADLNHTFYLYGFTESAPKNTNTNGPDECAPGGEKCPEVSHSRNLNGSVGVRLLGSYQDYRFRAPNLLLLQENFEHSIWGPFGLKFTTDQGRVSVRRSDLGFDHLKHSFAAGLTLRAGGFPMVSLMFAWGGPEGHHNIFNVNTSLLGGSSRPSLY